VGDVVPHVLRCVALELDRAHLWDWRAVALADVEHGRDAEAGEAEQATLVLVVLVVAHPVGHRRED
jgi:hypothetical protein